MTIIIQHLIQLIIIIILKLSHTILDVNSSTLLLHNEPNDQLILGDLE